MFYNDADNGFKRLPKITSDHINITRYSVMRVNRAAQVLSPCTTEYNRKKALGTF